MFDKSHDPTEQYPPRKVERIAESYENISPISSRATRMSAEQTGEISDHIGFIRKASGRSEPRRKLLFHCSALDDQTVMRNMKSGSHGF